MSVIGTVRQRTLQLSFAGEIDHHRARELMNQVDRYLDCNLPQQLQVDFSGVTFMDSSGIAILLRAYRWMERAGGRMEVAGVPDQVYRVLRAAQLDRVIAVKRELSMEN